MNKLNVWIEIFVDPVVLSVLTDDCTLLCTYILLSAMHQPLPFSCVVSLTLIAQCWGSQSQLPFSLHLVSGDDDLYVNKFISGSSVGVVKE